MVKLRDETESDDSPIIKANHVSLQNKKFKYYLTVLTFKFKFKL